MANSERATSRNVLRHWHRRRHGHRLGPQFGLNGRHPCWTVRWWRSSAMDRSGRGGKRRWRTANCHFGLGCGNCIRTVDWRRAAMMNGRRHGQRYRRCLDASHPWLGGSRGRTMRTIDGRCTSCIRGRTGRRERPRSRRCRDTAISCAGPGNHLCERSLHQFSARWSLPVVSRRCSGIALWSIWKRVRKSVWSNRVQKGLLGQTDDGEMDPAIKMRHRLEHMPQVNRRFWWS